MTVLKLETTSSTAQAPQTTPGRRQAHPEETLILTELAPEDVIDHLDDTAEPVVLTTFGGVRETCPKCLKTHLRLVLRQECVRTEHLFCPECASCFNAHYPSGLAALTV
jgi:hypothetical protein